MVGANVRRDVNHSETSQTNRISGSEMFLEEKGGEIEPKWEYTFISSGWEYLQTQISPLYYLQDKIVATLPCVAPFILLYAQDREDAKGNFSCSLGITEKSRRTFKMKAAFVEPKLPGQCN